MSKLKKSVFQTNSEIIANNITLLAAANGLRTDREISKRIGVSAATYCNRRHDPRFWTVEQLIKITIAFNTTLEWLVTKHEIGGE